ncbi:MAG: hypothetical protein GQ557_00395 [Mycoplasmataceae bacterium]|nr:hypothetical protein [Mycoplasmataceae bacterium]
MWIWILLLSVFGALIIGFISYFYFMTKASTMRQKLIKDQDNDLSQNIQNKKEHKKND